MNLRLLPFFFLLFTTVAFANSKNPKVEPAPVWITPVTINYAAASMDNDAQDGYSDLHYEKQVSLMQGVVFHRKAFHILTESGAEALSQVSAEFDPSFQNISFHSIFILRDGKRINQLNLSRIKTIQQEKELHQNIYDGSLTAMLILEDLRKGDVLEYSFSLQGFNPAFGNKYATLFTTQYAIPVYSQYYKISVPTNRSINVRNSLTNVQPRINTSPSETVYEWNIQAQPALHIEEDLPSWYDAYPMVMVSEYKSWKELNDWAMELYPFNLPLTSSLKQKVEELKRDNATPESRLLAALRFVQDEVRYMGVELGESGYKPHNPAQVLQQRFGDCKDKSYLLCTLLRGMNIEAWPVYINTTYKKTVASWLPSPTVFDHVTVCAALNGKQYWFDATSSHQRGSLSDISYPDYQAGLVIAPNTTAFTNIPLQNNGKIFTHERFIIDHIGSPAQLVVTTKFSGSFADNMRASFDNTSNRELLKGFKDLYEPYFKKIDADSLRYKDDEATGLLTTYEYYTVHDFWTEEDGKKKVSLSPFLINSVIKRPERTTRRMPFALPYPTNYEEHIEVELPEDWPISEDEILTQTTAFSINCQYIQAATNRVLLKYSYQNLTDHLAANEVDKYLNDWDEAEKKGLGYELTYRADSRTANSSVAFGKSENMYTTAYVILGVFALATFVYRNKSRRSTY